MKQEREGWRGIGKGGKEGRARIQQARKSCCTEISIVHVGVPNHFGVPGFKKNDTLFGFEIDHSVSC